MMGISTPAATALGAITQNEWSTYMQHFVPQENMLLQYATDTSLPGKNMGIAMGQQEQANAQAGGIEQRQLAQFDTQLTPEEQAEATKQRGIGNAVANVTAANRAKDVTVANQMAVMGAPQTGITGNV